MSIVQEIRQEASRIADSKGLEILDQAFRDASQTRFRRLRRRQAFPRTEREQEYMKALTSYVHYKILSKKKPISLFSNQARRFRVEMDRIEFNLT